jgi:hypothetical protein
MLGDRLDNSGARRSLARRLDPIPHLLRTYIVTAALCCLAVLKPVPATSGAAGSEIQRSFFGMHVLSKATPWPAFPVGSIRTWDTGTIWRDINTAPGRYNWSVLDFLIGRASGHRADVLINLGGTPAWAATNPNDDCGHGICSPPANAQYWTDWVSAVVGHVRLAWPDVRVTYEIWNEPNDIQSWNGSIETLVGMSAQAYRIIKAIDHKLQVICPPTNGFPDLATDGFAWAIRFLSLGGGSYCDIWGVHPYPGFYRSNPAPAEQALLEVQQYSNILRAFGLGAMPIWNTESSWGDESYLSSPASQAAYVGKLTMLLHSAGVQRSYWYAYDTTSRCPKCWGPLWAGEGTSLNAAGAAYLLMEKWFLGATPVNPLARVQGPNRVRNATARSSWPGTLPVHWQRTTNDVAHGIAQELTTGPGYVDWHVYGTAAPGASGFERIAFEESRIINCSGAGQQWWLSFKESLQSGFYQNVKTNMQLNEYDTNGTYLGNRSAFFLTTGLDYTNQPISWFATTASPACAYIQPLVAVDYQIGKPFDITLRLAAPRLDDGTQFVGTYRRADGSSAILAWNSGRGSTLDVAAPFRSYQDVKGVNHAIGSGSVALTSSPIFITAEPTK